MTHASHHYLIVSHYFPAVRLYKSRNCNGDDDDFFGGSFTEQDAFCNRTIFAISIGVVSGCVSFIWMIFGARLPALADVIMGWLMLTGWVFAILNITFGDEGEAPARNIGNLYFATWAGFIISCLLASSNLRAMFVTAGSEGNEGEITTEEVKPERAADEENGLSGDENNMSSDEVAVDKGDAK
jgi:hypothetical protein